MAVNESKTTEAAAQNQPEASGSTGAGQPFVTLSKSSGQ